MIYRSGSVPHWGQSNGIDDPAVGPCQGLDRGHFVFAQLKIEDGQVFDDAVEVGGSR
jgi:hypothetical protein